MLRFLKRRNKCRKLKRKRFVAFCHIGFRPGPLDAFQFVPRALQQMKGLVSYITPIRFLKTAVLALNLETFKI